MAYTLAERQARFREKQQETGRRRLEIWVRNGPVRNTSGREPFLAYLDRTVEGWSRARQTALYRLLGQVVESRSVTGER